MNTRITNIEADIETLSRISAVPSILDVICRTTGMGFAAVARVTEDRWVACAVKDNISFGLQPGGELKVETTICHEIRQHQQPVIIDHVLTDTHYADHHTPAMYGFQSYISVPITLKDGSFFGTLCAIDPKPAKLNTPEMRKMFDLFAELIAFHLQSVEELASAQANLAEERETAELRDQFIAILGHDLRNPIGAISTVAQMLLRMPLEDRIMRLAKIVQDSSFRIKVLIDNILDFARGRLGEGISLNLLEYQNFTSLLNQVITELQLVWPDRIIETDFKMTEPVTCDGGRIAQLFSNLLANALTHGQPDAPVKVQAIQNGKDVILSVHNHGKPIPDAAMKRLFQPFERGEVKPGQQGLGLGLYIASEIAKAHNGTLTAKSSPDETCFTLRMPISNT
ncbi:GAF domain-containing sensor histidine kinase [Mucilaginibacter sp. PAMB04168]|uniref:GAF domain-containing sensor histidine kinase n=1 Tax=Mucilaginibacter sp. PAMB04168 TaxID=3138567 RepID=UPI0031F6697F